MMLNENHLFLT